MSQRTNASLTADRPIPVGLLVSVTIGKKRISAPPSEQRKAERTYSGRTAETIATIGGVAAMLIFVALGAWLTMGRNAVKPASAAVPQTESIAFVNRPLPKQLNERPISTIVAAEINEKVAPFEAIAAMPREVAPEPELVSIEPREVVEAPLLALAGSEPPETRLSEPAAVIAARPKEKAPNRPDVLAPEVRPGCDRYGTKIDFLPMPSQAFALAGNEQDKLVMVLHIAGNFEDKGFT